MLYTLRKIRTMKLGNIGNFYQEYITFIVILYPQFTPQNYIATNQN